MTEIATAIIVVSVLGFLVFMIRLLERNPPRRIEKTYRNEDFIWESSEVTYEPSNESSRDD